MGTIATLPAIARLLEMGALTTSFMSITPELLQSLGEGPAEKLMKYRITPFGQAVLHYCVHHMGLLSPEMQPALLQLAAQRGQPPIDQA